MIDLKIALILRKCQVSIFILQASDMHPKRVWGDADKRRIFAGIIFASADQQDKAKTDDESKKRIRIP